LGASSCEHGNEHSESVKGGELPDLLRGFSISAKIVLCRGYHSSCSAWCRANKYSGG